ncbi:zinc-dependent metalloprotease [Pollutibacter soli]|uniref:zinc-dependent metalloprotease n=1 Tax=Pollutibacter soli TaxID=3034157 RepID=UPI003013A247
MKKFLLIFLLFPLFTIAQPPGSIDEKVAKMKKFQGYIPYYWDEISGKIWMEISRLDQEFLYVMSLPGGLGSNDIGLDRGLLGGGRVVKFTKTGRKILLVEPNYGFRAVSGDLKEKNAVENSFAKSTLWGFTVEAETSGRYLVDATDFLMRDAMQVTNRLRRGQQGNYTLDKSRSVIYIDGLKNFPLNAELEADLTWVNADGITGNYVNEVAPSSEAITLRMHHSFVQLPDSGYKPRLFDPRSGFYPVTYFDYSTPVPEPIVKYLACRHRLEKKDPSAAVSEAVKPIIYYLDNGTPEPIRTALLKGGNWWNQAFEAAGYKDAFQVKILPDTADPMDIRYNVINWVHRSTRGWSYGMSVTDPRTGEIIKGQVSLGSLRVRQDYLIAQGLLAPFETGVPADDKMLKMALERLEQLSAHEIGHTLGIMHNYASSVSNRASVMDYPHPLVKLNAAGEIDLSDAYDHKIGEWDKMAITWGYQDFPVGTNESQALNKILNDGSQKGLQFISDRDSRDPGGLHPQAHLWDNGTDASSELLRVLQIREKALANFGEKNIRDGFPLSMLEDVLVPIYFFHRYQVESAVKVLGGRMYAYKLKGDVQPYTKMVSKAEQMKALDALIKCIDPSVLKLPAPAAALIPPRPAGYDFGRELFRKRTGLMLDQLSPAESGADFPLSFIFHPARINRIVQQETEGGPSLTEVLNRLIENTWKAPRKTGLEKLIQLQTEQILLTYLLNATVDDKLAFPSSAIAQQTLNNLKSWINSRKAATTDPVYAGHLILALERIKAPEKAKPTIFLPVPPGAPIGCDEEIYGIVR